MPAKPNPASDFARVTAAIHFLRANAPHQPSLAEVASHVSLSEFHFQRLFQRWAGISPKRFLQFLTLQAAKQLLMDSHSVLETSLAVGLSGPSRLHDLFLTYEQMTPGQFKSRASGMRVQWGMGETLFGPALFSTVERGLCGLTFVEEGGEAQALEALARRWSQANLERSDAAIRPLAANLRTRMLGQPTEPLGLVLKGTPLQLRVWEALLRIPPGRVTTYGKLAAVLGIPNAARAVGTAVGQNAVGILIPCHRVIQATGALGGYAWGTERKAAALALEHAQHRG